MKYSFRFKLYSHSSRMKYERKRERENQRIFVFVNLPKKYKKESHISFLFLLSLLNFHHFQSYVKSILFFSNNEIYFPSSWNRKKVNLLNSQTIRERSRWRESESIVIFHSSILMRGERERGMKILLR